MKKSIKIFVFSMHDLDKEEGYGSVRFYLANLFQLCSTMRQPSLKIPLILNVF